MIRGINRLSQIKNNVKCVEFDEATDFILEEYSELTKDSILDFFSTADLNGDGSLDYGEFTRILRHVHMNFYLENKHRKLELIFKKFSEVDEESGEEQITQSKFKDLSLAYNIFLPEGQSAFLDRVSVSGLVYDVTELKEKWSSYVKPTISKCLAEIQSEDLSIFAERLESLILNFTEKNKHKIWLNYKILEGEIEWINTE